MDWDYDGGKVHVSMLNYIPKALTCFQHQAPRIPQHQPYPHIKPNYGAKAQYTEDADTLALPPKKTRNLFKRTSALSSIMRDVSTAPCLWYWGLLPHNR